MVRIVNTDKGPRRIRIVHDVCARLTKRLCPPPQPTHAHKHTCIHHTHTVHTSIHTYTYCTYMHTYIYTYIYLCTYTCMRAYTCIQTCWTWNIRIYIYIYSIYIYILYICHIHIKVGQYLKINVVLGRVLGEKVRGKIPQESVVGVRHASCYDVGSRDVGHLWCGW